MDFTIHACHVRQKGPPPADTMVIFCQRHNETMQHLLKTDNCFLHITSLFPQIRVELQEILIKDNSTSKVQSVLRELKKENRKMS